MRIFVHLSVGMLEQLLTSSCESCVIDDEVMGAAWFAGKEEGRKNELPVPSPALAVAESSRAPERGEELLRIA